MEDCINVTQWVKNPTDRFELPVLFREPTAFRSERRYGEERTEWMEGGGLILRRAKFFRVYSEKHLQTVDVFFEKEGEFFIRRQETYGRQIEVVLTEDEFQLIEELELLEFRWVSFVGNLQLSLLGGFSWQGIRETNNPWMLEEWERLVQAVQEENLRVVVPEEVVSTKAFQEAPPKKFFFIDKEGNLCSREGPTGILAHILV